MIYLQLFFEFLKIGMFAVGGGLATVPFLQALAEKYGNDGYDKWKDILNQIADNLEKYADTRFENAELSEHYWKEAFSLLSEWHTNMWD